MSGSSEKLYVDPDILNDQVRALESLIADTTLTKMVDQLPSAMCNSSGASAVQVKQMNTFFQQLNQNMVLLFERTKDFLTNTGTSFVSTDQNIAEKLRNEDA